MAKDLTAFAIEATKPGSSRREIPDGKVRGLYFIVQPSGQRSWALRYRRRADNATRKLTLGAYPAIDLTNARRLASKALTAVAENGDPAEDKQAARMAARKPVHQDLVENVVDRFIERHAKKNTRETSWKEAQRLLKTELVSRWKGKPIAAIGRSDIHAILDAIIDRGSPISANRALAVMSRLFSWSVERGLIPTSPCSGIRPPSPAKTRDRVLTDAELRLVWLACDQIGWPFGPLVRLLILTGQRRDEVGGITWDEVDLDERVWLLPKGRVKNDKGHAVPLSDAAIEIIENLPQIANRARYVFTTTNFAPVSGFTTAKRRFDQIIATLNGGVSIPPWTYHDLRRTLASGCARLGVMPQVVEAILNHRSGTIRGVAAVYNRYDHAAEKRAALDAWEKHVAAFSAMRTTPSQ